MADEVPDWRLRSIYDALDNLNPRQAVQQCLKLQKKYSKSLILKSLYGLALQRSDRSEEAGKVATELLQAQPTDPYVLQSLTYLFKALGQLDNIAPAYEMAYQKTPQDEEIANHYFMALVRTHKYKIMQQTAIKLNRNFANDKYLFWSVMSIHLQVLFPSAPTEDVINSKLLLGLAERMMAKATTEHKLTSYDHLHLYLDILDIQEKHEQKLSILQSNDGSTQSGSALIKLDDERSRLIVECAKKCNRWDLVITESYQVLEKSRNNWYMWTSLVESARATGTIDTNDSVSMFIMQQQRVELGHSNIKTETNTSTGVTTPQNRGPFLAELEFLKLQIATDNNTARIDFLEKIASYCDLFGSKSCCVDDLRPYLKILSIAEGERLVQEVAVRSGYDHNRHELLQSEQTIEYTLKKITYRKIQKLLAPYGSPGYADGKPIETYIRSLLGEYMESLSDGQQRLSTDRQSGDELLILAAHYLLDSYYYSNDKAQKREALCQCIAILETGLEHSPSNFQFRLVLIRSYLLLGAIKRPLELFEAMGIKNIQFDTLSYLIMEHAVNLGQYTLAVKFGQEARQIYVANERETPDMIVMAFQHATFSKIPEFIRFYHRLRQSVSKHVTNQEIWRAEMLSMAGTSSPIKQAIARRNDQTNNGADLSTLIDNRDVNVMVDWQANGAPRIEQILRVTAPYKKSYLLILSLTQDLFAQLVSETPDENMAVNIQSSIDALDNILQTTNDIAVHGGLSLVRLAQMCVSLGCVTHSVITGQTKDEVDRLADEMEKQVEAAVAAIQCIEESFFSYQDIQVCSSAIECTNLILAFATCPRNVVLLMPNGTSHTRRLIQHLHVQLGLIQSELQRLNKLVESSTVEEGIQQQLQDLIIDCTKRGMVAVTSRSWMEEVQTAWIESIRTMSEIIDRMCQLTKEANRKLGKSK